MVVTLTTAMIVALLVEVVVLVVVFVVVAVVVVVVEPGVAVVGGPSHQLKLEMVEAGVPPVLGAAGSGHVGPFEARARPGA